MAQEVHRTLLDPSSLAAAGFLSRYRQPTTSASPQRPAPLQDLVRRPQLQALQARPSRLEPHLRGLQDRAGSRDHQQAPVDRRRSVPPRRHRRVDDQPPNQAVTRRKVQ